MELERVDPDENYPLMKFATPSGRWEVGLSPVLYGVRVRAGVPDETILAIDYCAGADLLFQLRLLECIVNILRALPEELGALDVMSLMPTYARKPIDEDPCWEKLRRMEGRAILTFSPVATGGAGASREELAPAAPRGR